MPTVGFPCRDTNFGVSSNDVANEKRWP